LTLGGVLTIADDLLQNQGRQFIEMMEKIADMRFRKEEDARKEVQDAGGPYDDEYDDDGDEYYEEDEPEDSEEDDVFSILDISNMQDPKINQRRRMEEGRRMFHIFAARMFEQRVLAAYREKVARERQQKLLEEIEEEDRKTEERNSKKAKEKERKKEKQRLQKQQKEEERMKKEAEKAAEEAARRAEEERKAEELRLKKEEARLKREAERKQQEAERLRKEEERRKRQAEERERQQELERKKREKEEATKRRREENIKKDKEARETKEREARERKEREERERKDKTASKGNLAPGRRQSNPTSPSRTPASLPAVPKVPTPTPPTGRMSVPPTATTPPHPPFANGSTSSTPATHTPSPRFSNTVLPQLLAIQSGQSLPSSHFHVPIPPPPGSGFTSPSLRSQFPPIPENMPQHVMAGRQLQQGQQSMGAPPGVNGPPLGIYGSLPIGNVSQYPPRFAPGPNQQNAYSPANLPALPHSLNRNFADAVLPAPNFPAPLVNMPSHGSPIIPPPSKVESGVSSPQVSHSRKTSIDTLPDLSSLGPRHLPPGVNGSGPLPNPPGLSRNNQRIAPIQRPQSTASSGRGSGFMQDEEMGVGSRALLDDGVEDIGEDEIIEPTFGSAPGFGQSRRPNNPFPPPGDKLWAAPPTSSSDAVWGQQDKNSFLWGNMAPLSATDDHAFRNWDASPSINPTPLTDFQERIRDIIRTADRNDPHGYVFVDNIMAQLKRQNSMDRSTPDDIVIATQAAPTAFLVQPKKGKWAVRLTNPADSREVSRARMMTALGPKPGTPPSDLGRSMLGSLAEVISPRF
jgi:hypothetical protein